MTNNSNCNGKSPSFRNSPRRSFPNAIQLHKRGRGSIYVPSTIVRIFIESLCLPDSRNCLDRYLRIPSTIRTIFSKGSHETESSIITFYSLDKQNVNNAKSKAKTISSSKNHCPALAPHEPQSPRVHSGDRAQFAPVHSSRRERQIKTGAARSRQPAAFIAESAQIARAARSYRASASARPGFIGRRAAAGERAIILSARSIGDDARLFCSRRPALLDIMDSR